MKKFIVSILALLYLTTSTGATVQMHYCMNKLVGWDLNGSDSDECSNCGMEKSQSTQNGCCKDKQNQVKLQDDQNLTKASVSQMQYSSLGIPVVLGTCSIEPLPAIAQEFPVSHAPPQNHGNESYLFNCVFRL